MLDRRGSTVRWLAVLAIGVVILVTTEAAVAARCGRYVIAPGDHQVEVLDRCGEPDYEATRIVYPYRVRGDRSFDVQVLELPTRVEEWVYQGEHGHFGQLLRFHDGRLTDVELLDKRR